MKQKKNMGTIDNEIYENKLRIISNNFREGMIGKNLSILG